MTASMLMTAPMFARLVCCIQGISIYLKTDGKMQLTRVATPKVLRQIATEFTGKKYARSRQGLQQALEDLTAKKEALIKERETATKPESV